MNDSLKGFLIISIILFCFATPLGLLAGVCLGIEIPLSFIAQIYGRVFVYYLLGTFISVIVTKLMEN